MWGQDKQAAFNKLKEHLFTAPVLEYVDPSQSSILDTIARNCGVGAVLSQLQLGAEKVIAFFSKTLTTTERNYCMMWRELLAVVNEVKHFQLYLYSTQFLLCAKHASLQWLCCRKEPFNQNAKRLMIPTEFQFTLEQ